MHNALSPDRMRAEERLAEVARLLAAGCLRLRMRTGQRTPVEQSPVRLDFSPAKSGRCEPHEQRWEAGE
jgi:hypothetical protein